MEQVANMETGEIHTRIDATLFVLGTAIAERDVEKIYTGMPRMRELLDELAKRDPACPKLRDTRDTFGRVEQIWDGITA